MMNTDALFGRTRIDWVDYAKGICIVAVVTFYATGYVEGILKSSGWMHYFVEFARPFRMPDFFLVSGLFVSRVIDRPWRSYIDTKVVHFMYFYALWVTIKFVLINAGGLLHGGQGNMLLEYLDVYLQPHGPLWFIYILPLFFIAVRLLRSVPVWLVLIGVVALKLADLDTGWKMIDRFGMYFVFFYAGHLFASRILDFADWAKRHPRETVMILGIWAGANAVWVKFELPFIPLGHLLTGLAGASAVILVSTLLTRVNWMRWLRYLGEHSLVVYLAFVVPLNVLRRLIAASVTAIDPGTVSFLATALSIAGALGIYWAVRNTPLGFLFKRPAWISLRPAPAAGANGVLKKRKA